MSERREAGYPAEQRTGPERPGAQRRERASMSILDPTNVDRPLVDIDLAELAAVSAELEHKPASAAIKWAWERFGTDVVLAASFQDCVLIDVASKAAPGIEVVFLDTQYHFAETLWYVERIRERYDLNLTVMQPLVEPDDLWQTDPDECCAMRKVEPLARALAGKQAWMTGLRRVEAPTRATTPYRAPRHRPRHREGQPARAVDRRRHRRLQARPRAARAPARGAGLPLDRLLALHASGQARRRPPFGALGRTGQDGMRPARLVRTRKARRKQPPMNRLISHLDALEAESIHLLREVAAEFERPVLLFSGGKDSVVMLHIAKKAFWPARLPFPVMHVDTGHNFPEVIEFRDAAVEQLECQSRRRVGAGRRSTPAASSRNRGRARRATACRRPRCSTRSRSTGSTR